MYPTVTFSGTQYAILPALVRSNPKLIDVMGGQLRQSDIQQFYDQKEGISLTIPHIPEPIRIWWRHSNPHDVRYPLIIWDHVGFGLRNFDVLFCDLTNNKRNHHMFAVSLVMA
eukprot:scaffold150698_cov49-Attheya_sp.AAC.1